MCAGPGAQQAAPDPNRCVTHGLMGGCPQTYKTRRKGEEPKLGFWGGTHWRSLRCRLKGQRPEVLPWQNANWFHLSGKMWTSLGTEEGSGAPLLTSPSHTLGLCHSSSQLWGQPSPWLLLTRAPQGGAPLSHNPWLPPGHAGRDPISKRRGAHPLAGLGSTRGGLSDQGSCHHTTPGRYRETLGHGGAPPQSISMNASSARWAVAHTEIGHLPGLAA